MPWWSWVVIWCALVAALLAMLAFAGWRLFRKATRVFSALGDLADKTELIHEQVAGSAGAPWHPAVLDDRRLWRGIRERNRNMRRLRRLRRIEYLVHRGKLLVKDDPERFSYLGRRVEPHAR